MFFLVLSLLLCQQVSALKTISAEEFATFPPMNHLDPYPQCMDPKGGAYCVATAKIVADEPNELYDKLMNFSFSAPRHYDLRNIRYGYCMTQRRCKEFYTGDSDAALEAALGACLNHTLQQEYGLRARVERSTCYHHGNQLRSTTLDRFAIAVYLTLIGLSVAGTLYDLLATKKDIKGYLMCFSIPANWAKLTAPWPQNQSRLIGINGIRFLNSAVTVSLHTLIPIGYTVHRAYSMEELMESDGYRIFGNTHIIVLTFMFMSGMFLAYTTQASAERSPMTWNSLPKEILLRWLRLSPVYLVVILYCTSLSKYTPQGPLWQEVLGGEIHDCQRDWLSMMFYYNNYVVGSQCNPHMWSTAADIHLYMVGLVVLLLPAGARVASIGLLIAAGMAASGLETYFRDLDGVHISGGKYFYSQQTFVGNDDFNYLHKRTHTNMPIFFIGMAFGLFLYKWMKNSVDTTNYKRYWWVYRLTVPLLFAVMYAHSYLALAEGERRSMLVRVLFAMFPKPIWGVLLAALIFGMVCRVENLYRGVLEWPGYVPLTRLSYCAFNVHMVIIRWLYASDSQLAHFSEMNLAVRASGVVVLSYVLAAVVWLLVEAPSTNVTRKLFPEKKSVLDVNTATKKTE